MPSTRRARIATVVAACALLSGCYTSSAPANRAPHTGSGAASTVGGLQQITVKAGDDLRFHPSVISVHPGRVRVVLVNDGKGAPHNWQLPMFPTDFVPTTPAGNTSQAAFTAPAPGNYQFVCTIHERQGQTGRLVVLPK